MSASRPDRRGLVLAATACAAVVLASQLAGKAARDAIFLQQFPVTNLPALLAVSSALAIGATFLFARRLSRGVPVRVVQTANVASALVLVLEWILLEYVPRPVAVIIYMHQSLLGPILVSGFWSVVSESFDPRSARRVLGTIATGATVGAVIGAVIAERVAAIAGTHALLPTIAGLQLFAAWRLAAVGRSAQARSEPERPAVREFADKMARVSLLRRLALVTVIVTVAAAMIDYLFKAAVSRSVQSDDLARVFATFHGVVGVLTAVVQWLLGRWALQTFGLARTLATLPGAVIVFGVTAMIAPGIGTFVALRGAENVLRHSLYREAYEVFYTPLLTNDRRATKTVIDVGLERFGDVLGGLTVLAILVIAMPATTVLLLGAIVLSALGMIVALKAQQSYVEALERSLLARSLENDDANAGTSRRRRGRVTGRHHGSDRPPRRVQVGRWRFARARPPPIDRPQPESSLDRITELACGDADRIRRALASPPLSHAAVGYAIPLLGRVDVSDAASTALAAVARSCTGQLVDALRDPQLPVVVRRRLPRLIARAGGDLARTGLLAALADPELDVRYAAAQALAELHERQPEIVFDPALIFDGVRRELSIEAALWKARQAAAFQAANPAAHAAPPRGPVPLSRAVQHVATLLALALPAEPIHTAFHGLWSDDASLRGVALEYLDNVLPDDIRELMWILLAIEAPPPGARRPIEDVLTDLLEGTGSTYATNSR